MILRSVLLASAICLALRLAVPALARKRELPRALERRLQAMYLPILAAIVAQDLFTRGTTVAIDARSAGVALGAALLLARRSLVLAALAAAAGTALVRLV